MGQIVNDVQASFAIAGKPAVGQRLRVAKRADDPDGNSRFKHAWQASSDGLTWTTIGSGSRLTIGEQHLGRSLRLRTTYTDAEGFKESVLTTAGTIAAANRGQASFSITGTPIVGQQLRVAKRANDPDGNGRFKHAWQASSDGLTWATIGSGKHFSVTEEHKGKSLRIYTRYIDRQGFKESVAMHSSVQVENYQGLIESTTEQLVGKVEAKNEVDSFKLVVPEGAIITASVESTEGGLYPLIELTDPNGAVLKQAIAYDANSADLGMYDLITGEAIVSVRAQAGKTGPYSLSVSVFSRDELKEEVVSLTNSNRMAAGLDPLTRNPLLDQAAQLHVEDMDNNNRYLAHEGSNGSTAVDRIKATGYKAAWVNEGDGSFRRIRSENAAAGQISPQEVVTSWMNSDGHRAAIMDAATKEIGVGFEYDIETGRTYWIQTFGNPWSDGMRQWY